MEEHERIRISGVINDVTFTNPENGFTVLELESGDELITAVGVMPELKAGELLELSGYWDFHASFGRQFRVELCEHKMPASAGDILRYLAAGGVKGIGSKLAVKIVDKFGENTLDIIENDPRAPRTDSRHIARKGEADQRGFQAPVRCARNYDIA